MKIKKMIKKLKNIINNNLNNLGYINNLDIINNDDYLELQDYIISLNNFINNIISNYNDSYNYEKINKIIKNLNIINLTVIHKDIKNLKIDKK